MLDTKDRIAPVQERVPKESYCERQLSIRRKRIPITFRDRATVHLLSLLSYQK
jgi:hypothetical protein